MGKYPPGVKVNDKQEIKEAELQLRVLLRYYNNPLIRNKHLTTCKEINLNHPTKKSKLSDVSVNPPGENYKNRISNGSSTAGSQLQAETHVLILSFAQVDDTRACISE